MSYIERSLAQNERLLYRAHFHWFYRAAAWAFLILGVAGDIVAYEPGLRPLYTSDAADDRTRVHIRACCVTSHSP